VGLDDVYEGGKVCEGRCAYRMRPSTPPVMTRQGGRVSSSFTIARDVTLQHEEDQRTQ
jgi:hypothetical protein